MIPAEVNQVDAVLTESGDGVLFMGHTRAPDATFIAFHPLPASMAEADFDHTAPHWREIASTLSWRQA